MLNEVPPSTENVLPLGKYGDKAKLLVDSGIIIIDESLHEKVNAYRCFQIPINIFCKNLGIVA